MIRGSFPEPFLPFSGPHFITQLNQTPVLSGVRGFTLPRIVTYCDATFACSRSISPAKSLISKLTYSGQSLFNSGIHTNGDAISQCFYSPSLDKQTQLLPTSPPSVSACHLPGSSTNHQPPRSNSDDGIHFSSIAIHSLVPSSRSISFKLLGRDPPLSFFETQTPR